MDSQTKKPAGRKGKLHASGDRNDDAYASDAPAGHSGAPRYDANHSESQGGPVAPAATPERKQRATGTATSKASTKSVPPLRKKSDTAAAPPARGGASPGKQGSLK